MAPKKSTYVTYNEGIDSRHLHLGNLVHDYQHPRALEPYIEKAYTDITEPAPSWATSAQIENCALTLGKDSENEERYRVVAAEKTTKLDIKEPKEFFNEVTLASDEAKRWIRARISAAESLEDQGHAEPEIWMLTGLILMTHATWTSLSSSEHSFTPGTPAPFDPNGVSAMRRLSVSDGVKPTFGFRATEEAKNVDGSTVHETGKYPGTKGWAARWQKVDVLTLPVGKWNSGIRNQFMLKSNADKIAVLEMGETVAQNSNLISGSSEEPEDEYWDAFLESAERFY
ncbi:hypothetical protein BJ875DRAFT_465813 [Amylocarpus encephaloides]|uniref:Uncharacterized protein n=1 Tax=Amylocarpus encephaloides TaxID=45428 RepID=A0A9P8C3Q1_9HELO|nr:hypothetical protein BJ875DRAFT_465813 [Amylocarpus encephaloides]